MPYKVVKAGDQYDVINTDTGESKGKSKTKAMAQAHARALYAATGSKSFDGYVWEFQLDQTDVNYDPVGMKDSKACANCHFFDSPDGCGIVSGDISPTGICDYWRAITPSEPYVTPVEVTNFEDMTVGVKAEERKPLVERAKDWITGLFNQDAETLRSEGPVGLRPIYMTKDDEGNTRATLVFSNNFLDKHGQIIPEVVHTEYIDWVERTGLYPEFQVWHRGAKSRWGEADLITRIGHFTVASGLVDPGKEDLAIAFANDPNTGLSNGYYALFADEGKKEFVSWYPWEISALPVTSSANVWMGDEHILESEGYLMRPEHKATLLAKGLKSEFLDELEADILARGGTVNNAGIASKEDVPTEGGSVGSELATLFGAMLDEKLNPVVARIAGLEEGQKSFETWQKEGLDNAILAKVASLPQGFKASESPTTITNQLPGGEPAGMDYNWLGSEIDKALAAGGLK